MRYPTSNNPRMYVADKVKPVVKLHRSRIVSNSTIETNLITSVPPNLIWQLAAHLRVVSSNPCHIAGPLITLEGWWPLCKTSGP